MPSRCVVENGTRSSRCPGSPRDCQRVTFGSASCRNWLAVVAGGAGLLVGARGALRNSLLLAGAVGATTTVLGLAFALLDARSRLWTRRLLGPLSLVPIITPAFVLGLAFIYLFGRRGSITHGLLGLDTGGMNAGLLAGHPQFASMTFAKSRSIGPRRNVAVIIDEIDWFDDCVHLGNASGWYRSNTEREPALDVLLQQIYDGVLTAPAAQSPATERTT